jgi:hypothetical protein
MALFKKKSDPISDRARALNEEIAELEAQIKQLDGKLQEKDEKDGSGPRLRSTAVPQGSTISHVPLSSEEPTASPAAPVAHEPIFEEVNQNLLKSKPETTTTPGHFNELGVRKYDLPALWQRIRNHFRGPSTTNPRLVSYLAAGGIQGLRPLRYEKRVARNRFIVLVVGLFLLLLGIILVFTKQHR